MKRLIIALVVLCFWTSLALAETATITFQDNSANETGFTLERNLNGGAFQALPNGTLGANVTTVTDTTLVKSTIDNTYCYRVRAFNAAGVSTWATGTATTPACVPVAKLETIPIAPSNEAAVLTPPVTPAQKKTK